MTKRLTSALLIVLCVFIIAGALPLGKSDINPSVIFTSPVFIFLNAILMILLIQCCFLSFSKSFRYLSFLLTHLGCAIILIGAFISFLFEKEMEILVPTNGNKPGFTESQMLNTQLENKAFAKEAGFDVFCTQFNIEYFPVDAYELYKRKENSPPEFILKAKLNDKYLNLGTYGKIETANLKSKEGFQGWNLFYPITDELFLLVSKPADKEYFCKLKFINNNRKEVAIETKVNHPAIFEKWRFYLMDYDHKKHNYVILSARSDPGRSLVIPGIWILMAGIAGLCYIIPRTRKNANCL